jgi:16S rRNA G966 N2-methylase RsmD
MKLAKEFDVDKEINLIKEDMLQFLERTSQTFDIIFADPPYEYKHYHEIIEIVFRKNLLKPDGLLILEHGKFTDLSAAPHYQYSRTYGNVIFSFFENIQDDEG